MSHFSQKRFQPSACLVSPGVLGVPALFRRAGKQCRLQAEQEGSVEGLKVRPGWDLHPEGAPGGMGQNRNLEVLLLLCSFCFL